MLLGCNNILKLYLIIKKLLNNIVLHHIFINMSHMNYANSLPLSISIKIVLTQLSSGLSSLIMWPLKERNKNNHMNE